MRSFDDLGFAKIDTGRPERCGAPEAVFREGKTPDQVARIVARMNEGPHDILATRAVAETYAAVKRKVPNTGR